MKRLLALEQQAQEAASHLTFYQAEIKRRDAVFTDLTRKSSDSLQLVKANLQRVQHIALEQQQEITQLKRVTERAIPVTVKPKRIAPTVISYIATFLGGFVAAKKL